MRLLVVEDDRLLNNTLCYNLSVSGYAVDSAMTMAEAVRFFETQDYDLIVLDVNLPDGNGFDFCKQIKERRPDTAVIFLTANDMEVSRKQVSVLLGRIQKQTGGDRYTNGTLSINFSELTAELSGLPITFTPLEYRLLKVLVRNPKIVLTRQVLLEKLWDVDENFVDEHTLTVTISRIRSKIEVDGLQYIKTVYGMGYMWIGGLKK